MRLYWGALGGWLGAFLVAAFLFALQGARITGPPAFVDFYLAVFGSRGQPLIETLFATLLFAVGGGLWGVIYSLAFRQSTAKKGALFGLVPTIVYWLVGAPMSGRPAFGGLTAEGLLVPIAANCFVWGGFVGWLCRQALRTEPAPVASGSDHEPAFDARDASTLAPR